MYLIRIWLFCSRPIGLHILYRSSILCICNNFVSFQRYYVTGTLVYAWMTTLIILMFQCRYTVVWNFAIHNTIIGLDMLYCIWITNTLQLLIFILWRILAAYTSTYCHSSVTTRCSRYSDNWTRFPVAICRMKLIPLKRNYRIKLIFEHDSIITFIYVIVVMNKWTIGLQGM